MAANLTGEDRIVTGYIIVHKLCCKRGKFVRLMKDHHYSHNPWVLFGARGCHITNIQTPNHLKELRNGIHNPPSGEVYTLSKSLNNRETYEVTVARIRVKETTLYKTYYIFF